jgi:hypothetical protein
MGQIAGEQGVSQATVSHRINEGLEQLRGILRRQGLLVGSAALGTMLMESTSQAIVPAAVSAGLSKMAMVGTTGTAAGLGGKTAVALNAGAVKAMLATATVVAAASVVGYLHHSHRPPSTAQPSSPARVIRQTVPTRPGRRDRKCRKFFTCRNLQVSRIEDGFDPGCVLRTA